MISRSDLAFEVGRAVDRDVMGLVASGSSGFSATYRITFDNGSSAFVKARSDDLVGVFREEADGLRWLAETRAVRVPEVLAVRDEDPTTDRFLVLTWVDQHLPAPDHDEQLGRDLARLHRSGAPAFGLDHDNFIADLNQSNQQHDSWAGFYATERLEPLARQAVNLGLLPPGAASVFDRLLERMRDLVGPAEPPARLHGDLWRGNVLAGVRGEPWLIDPAVYGGHREMDLAMMQLFGGFGPRCFAAYAEAFPLSEGHEDRLALYQLYPLLVHVLLFGESYASSAMHAAARYVN